MRQLRERRESDGGAEPRVDLVDAAAEAGGDDGVGADDGARTTTDARTEPAGARTATGAGTSRNRGGLGGAFLQGLLTNLSNPKAVIFFGSVFTRFVTPEMGIGEQALIVVVLAVTSIIWFGGVAWGLGLPRFANGLHRAGPWIDAISGAVFLALSAAIIVEGVTAL